MKRKREKMKKGIACLVLLFMILMSTMSVALAQDALDDTAERKHIQEQAAAEEFKSQDMLQTIDISSTGLSFTVYATLEDCVGGTTANGHVIVSHDHFVALPSRKALCTDDKAPHEYEVRITYPKTGLSVVAPVWDVGPWNTKDDYWNPSSERQMWKDLSQGMPEAQAASQTGYNGGFDETNYLVKVSTGSDEFSVGDRVRPIINDLSIRSTAGGDKIGSVSTSDRGTVIDGPQKAILNGLYYRWWKITWNKGLSGWSAQKRYVSNPAGIDLANGTFWDDLGMTDNDWVTVEFLWMQNTIAAVSTYNTILDDLDELVTKGKIPGYDLYTDSNIDQLWVNLDQYKILLIDEDCIFEWTNPCDPSCNKPIPTTTVGLSFYNHKAQLGQWTFNGGGLFCTDQNDVSPDYLHNVWWTWLPDELQVESNEFPSDYPDIGYGHYPENLEIISDPWIFSTPNEIDITKVDKDECHGRFTYYPGYTGLVRDKSDGDILEVYREYGSGVVVLSHVEYETAHPYDVDYIENEINFVKPERKEIKLKLYIEDAIAGRVEGSPPVANKAPGDIIDMVAQIGNEEDVSYNVDVTVKVPAGLIYKKCFSRADFMDIEENPIDPVISGNKYTVTINLGKSGTKEASKQIVWRFKIPEDAATTGEPTVYGEVEVDGEICDKSDTQYSMAANVKAIIVTNRYLLFEKYGDPAKGSSKDVEDLLNYLYQIGDSGDQNCIIYYVDKWDETPNQIIKDWDNTKIDYDAGEETINTVVKAIDNLAEFWISRSSPEYFILLGDDRILPHYRVNDADYTNEETKPEYKVTALNLPDQATLYALANNYFISDNIYGDTDCEDVDKGKLEIVASRIVGMSASEMKRFIERGIKGPSINNKAIVASQTEHPLWFQLITSKPYIAYNAVIEILKKWVIVDLDKLNEGEWKKDDLIAALQGGFQVFTYFGHSSWNNYAPSDSDLSSFEISDIDSNGCISNNKPFIANDGCRLGVFAIASGEPSMLAALIKQGISGSFGAGGLSYASSSGIWWGDELTTEFFKQLNIASSDYTKEVGIAFNEAKKNYNKGLIWDKKDKKTLLEYVLYGIPWMKMDPVSSTENSRFSIEYPKFSINILDPVLLPNGNYSRIIEINIKGYNVTILDGFDLITIEGAGLSGEEFKPTLPCIDVSLFLPSDTLISELNLVDSTSNSIGTYNIPCTKPDPNNTLNTIITNETDVVGFYPSPIYTQDVTSFSSYLKASINIAPIQHNPQTNETILYNYTKLELTYQTPVSLAITDFTPDKTEYLTGETINAALTVENVGSEALTGLHANLSLKDSHGIIKAFSLNAPFDVASGESKTVYATLSQNLPHGSYLAEIAVINSTGEILGSSSEYIYINTGSIVGFLIPPEVMPGEDIAANITFKNDYTTNVMATGLVYIYDPHNIEIAELYSVPTEIAANSTGTMNITWSTVGRGVGNYTASAVVFVGDEAFGHEYRTFTIKSSNPPVADANGPYAGIIEYIAVPITFDGTGSYDPDGTKIKYAWDLDNDGEFDDAVGATPTVSFTAPCLGNIHLKVTDNNGATDTDTTTLTITKQLLPPGGLLTPPEQPQCYSGTSKIQGKGDFTIDESIQDWATAIDTTEQIEGTGEFEMDSKTVLDQAANPLDFYDPNFYHKKTMQFQGNATNRLINRETFKSSGIFGGTGTRISEYFDVSAIQKDESSSIKTISAPGSGQSHRFATMDDFTGIWGIHSDWQKICQKEIVHHQMFRGNFSVQKDLTFEREVIAP